MAYYRAILPASNPTQAATELYQEANHTVHGKASAKFNRIKIFVIYILFYDLASLKRLLFHTFFM
jgi:hypothetical protein